MKWLAVHGIVNLFPPTENITIYSLLLQQTSDPTYTDTYTHARTRALRQVISESQVSFYKKLSQPVHEGVWWRF